MPFTVEEFQDLIRLLEQHPEWRAELRRHVLSDELLELPAVVRQLADQLTALTARLDDSATSRETLRTLYDQIDSLPDLGRVPHPDLYLQAADVLEKIGRRDEAAAWRRLAGAD